MPAKNRNPRGAFALFPDTKASKEVLRTKGKINEFSNQENKLFQKRRNFKRSIPVKLPSPNTNLTLITLGRRGSWEIKDQKVADIQCSFEIHRLTGEILLYDRSPNASTVLLGNTATAFGVSPRRVVVNDKINLQFGFPGSHDGGFKWTISWAKIPPFPLIHGPRGPRGMLPRTIWELPADRARSTTLHTIGISQAMRVLRKRLIGTGPSSYVYEAVDIDSGGYVAVKDFRLPQTTWDLRPELDRITKAIARQSHVSLFYFFQSHALGQNLTRQQPHIVEFIGAQQTPRTLEIITSLKQGNITDLKEYFREDLSRTKTLLHQMLQALDYMAVEGITYCDVCPGNILYTERPDGSYNYQLNNSSFACIDRLNRLNSPNFWFVAPELMANPNRDHTLKAAIWSLFTTIVFTLDLGRIRDACTKGLPISIPDAIYKAASFFPDSIKAMAEPSPDARPTAGELLDQVFGGEGRAMPPRRKIIV